MGFQGFRVQGLGFGVQGFRVQGSGFKRVWGSGVRVWGLRRLWVSLPPRPCYPAQGGPLIKMPKGLFRINYLLAVIRESGNVIPI